MAMKAGEVQGQKYPKSQFDYEDDYWRKISDKQSFQRKFLLVMLLLMVVLNCVLYSLIFFPHWFF